MLTSLHNWYTGSEHTLIVSYRKIIDAASANNRLRLLSRDFIRTIKILHLKGLTCRNWLTKENINDLSYTYHDMEYPYHAVAIDAINSMLKFVGAVDDRYQKVANIFTRFVIDKKSFTVLMTAFFTIQFELIERGYIDKESYEFLEGVSWDQVRYLASCHVADIMVRETNLGADNYEGYRDLFLQYSSEENYTDASDPSESLGKWYDPFLFYIEIVIKLFVITVIYPFACIIGFVYGIIYRYFRNFY